MSWVAVGVTAATVVGGAMQANSAKKASAAQSRSEESALAEQGRQFDLTREDTAPWRAAGGMAIGRARDLLGLGDGSSFEPDRQKQQLVLSNGSNPIGNHELYHSDPIYKKAWDEAFAAHVKQYGVGYNESSNPDAIENTLKSLMSQERQRQGIPEPTEVDGTKDPLYGSLNKKFTVDDFWSDPVTKLGFDFGLSEGRKGIEQTARAGGMRNSGSTLKALTRFGTDYAGTKAGESYNRFYGDQDRTFNRLSGISGTGQTATTNTAAMGQQSAMNMGNIMTAGGNARGAAAIAQGNAWGGAFNNIGNWWNQQQMMKQLTSGNQTQAQSNAAWLNQNAPS